MEFTRAERTFIGETRASKREREKERDRGVSIFYAPVKYGLSEMYYVLNIPILRSPRVASRPSGSLRSFARDFSDRSNFLSRRAEITREPRIVDGTVNGEQTWDRRCVARRSARILRRRRAPARNSDRILRRELVSGEDRRPMRDGPGTRRYREIPGNGSEFRVDNGEFDHVESWQMTPPRPPHS